MNNTVRTSEKGKSGWSMHRHNNRKSLVCWLRTKRKGVKISHTQREKRCNDDGDTFHAALGNINM